MDIFTTQLTRVVQIPIKPANLKVKALLKDAGAGKLKEDLDHLENHDYYFAEKKSDKEQQDGEQKSKQESNENSKQEHSNKPKDALIVESTDSVNSDSKLPEKVPSNAEEDGITESKDGTKHLDLYI